MQNFIVMGLLNYGPHFCQEHKRFSFLSLFSRVHATLQPALSVGRSVGWLVGRSVSRSVTLELKSGKMGISAPAHPSATDERVFGLVLVSLALSSPKKSVFPLKLVT